MEAAVPIAVFSLIMIAAAVYFFGRRGETTDEMQELVRRMAPPPEETLDVDITRKSRQRDERLFGVLLMHIDLLQRLEERMWQAGLYMRVSEILLIMVLLLGAGGALGFAMWGDLLIAAGLGLGLSMLPIVYVQFRRKARLKAFSQQLPEVLDMIKSSLEAGHSLLRGLQVIVEEFGDPVSSEFRMVLEQTRLGMPMPRAFEDLLKRIPDENLSFLVVAIKVQSAVGSSLAEIVGRLSETIRTRQRIELQIRALTAQPRYSGMIVGALPFLILAFFSVVQPDYVHMLFYDPIGQNILKLAIGLDLAAFLIIRRILKLDF